MSKYLASHAEPEAALAEQIRRDYLAALIVPTCGEHESLLDGFQDALSAAPGKTLLVLVVNATDAASEVTHDDNRRLLAHLIASFPEREPLGPVATLGLGSTYDLLWIDRANEGQRLPAREGVGLARKIGGDVAAALHQAGRIACPRLACTDADVTLPADYFTALTREVDEAPTSAAWLWPFRHVPGADDAIDRATELYEISLRYYVLGLAAAGSPYAYQSIGSTLCIDARAYQSVRGFPKREAGEDFYVLDKLAKVAPLRRIASAPIAIRARASARVPFGTGRRSGEIALELAAGKELELYEPRTFEVLAAVVRGLDDFAESARPSALAEALEARVPQRASAALGVLGALGALSALESAASQAPRGPVLRRRVHTWFDALRTLRFVHGLRDAALPSIPWRDALSAAPFCAEPFRGGAGPDAACRHLLALEATLPARVGPSLY